MRALILVLALACASQAQTTILSSCSSAELSAQKCTLKTDKVLVNLSSAWIQTAANKKVATIDFPTQGTNAKWISAEIQKIGSDHLLLIQAWDNPTGSNSVQQRWITLYKVNSAPAMLIDKQKMQSRSSTAKAGESITSGFSEYSIEKTSSGYKLIKR